uniref:WD_REPEATS_REGION domain-containing protein n=1 Tax=Angiostrongylus cantonensis TaxID=6313 RepID=A0A0K0DNJ9_ANGCA
MHLLAIADTLSHFSTNAMDKLTQANAAMKPVIPSVLGDSMAGGYAAAASGIETVDECGLRYLMAMKQHEYLLLCLPIKQRMELKKNGIASSDIIWAQHSETETELLNAIPSLQKSNPTWEELRSLGIAWWLKNTASLKICVEKLAKAAFQQNQDPMDSSLFYLALKKKNLLTHLFKTIRNQQMADFFMQDFNTDHWKKTILYKCNDLQLAMVILRLYESDIDSQQSLLKDMLCREVLGQSVEEFEQMRGNEEDDIPLGYGASRLLYHSRETVIAGIISNNFRDPFVRSMAYWILKDYSRSAHTLVQEAHGDSATLRTNLSDIFNFYSFLRKHPLVMRQRLTNAGAQVGSTEQFLVVAKQLETLVTPSERRLYFRTAAEHMAHGCPMLALDVLSRLPKNISMVKDGSFRTLITGQVTNTFNEDLVLEYSDDDGDEEFGEGANKTSKKGALSNGIDAPHPDSVVQNGNQFFNDVSRTPDVIAQHLKFVASLRILTEELSTLASGFEVDGGQLRYQLLIWLDKEVNILQNLCDYQSTSDAHVENNDENFELESDPKSFTSYCALHSAQNHRLTSALMELLLLLLEIQKDTGVQHLSESVLDTNSFPLLVASVSSAKMFVSSPLSFIENQCYDLLTSIADLTTVPDMDNHLQKAYKLYNLSQGLSSSLYQSLCDMDQFFAPSAMRSDKILSALTRRIRGHTCTDDVRISTPPDKWPGVNNLVALLSREKDDETPHLRLVLAECFIAITLSLFCFALAVYDSRWLYRLVAHDVDAMQFSLIFEIPGVAPRVQAVLRLLDEWEIQLRQCLKLYRGGCPVDLLPNMTIDTADASSLPMKKYAVITEKHNTPFESEDPRAGPLQRLWAYLTRQENLQPLFIRHIFASRGQQEQPIEKNDALATIENHPLPDAFKIIQKDSEPIVAFACDQERPGWLVVSTGRELQEMDISGIFEECNNASSWLYNRTELDINLPIRHDPLKETDDYQLFTEGSTQQSQAPKAAAMVEHLTPWIIDRSRKGLRKHEFLSIRKPSPLMFQMFKRTISGIRRIDSHPNAPLYVTGSSDGSIRVWEWGVGQPVYTARVAGQYAKVSKISFSCNGNKFAAVDGDGMMCLWEACRSAELKKPFFVGQPL